MFGPQIYLILALVAALPATYGVMWVKRELAVKAAYTQGQSAGAGQTAAATTKAAGKTVAAVAEGEAATPSVPADKAAIIALCQRSASCRERKRP